VPLEFTDEDRPEFEPAEEMVCWHGWIGGMRRITCKATRSAINALSPEATNLTNEDRVSIFNERRRLFERVASQKYDAHNVTENNEIVVSAADIAKCQRR
jgi:hypothetical protein